MMESLAASDSIIGSLLQRTCPIVLKHWRRPAVPRCYYFSCAHARAVLFIFSMRIFFVIKEFAKHLIASEIWEREHRLSSRLGSQLSYTNKRLLFRCLTLAAVLAAVARAGHVARISWLAPLGISQWCPAGQAGNLVTNIAERKIRQGSHRAHTNTQIRISQSVPTAQQL